MVCGRIRRQPPILHHAQPAAAHFALFAQVLKTKHQPGNGKVEVFRAVVADIGVQIRAADEISRVHIFHHRRDAPLGQQPGRPGLLIVPAAQNAAGQGLRRNVFSGGHTALLLLFQHDFQALRGDTQDNIAIAFQLSCLLFVCISHRRLFDAQFAAQPPNLALQGVMDVR